ncbi:hypothetical protein DdX_13694 [Ditylenchus destructor]|uniref:Uncharacterized protein n=1 Tax=Ditylenchus destructor TaxID=166010 RepID=A0AAD4QWC2_9BILA|nr:hypothetical protein DdX_13694 [Ditylenchus destructor]
MKSVVFSIFVILVLNLTLIIADRFYGPKDCKQDVVERTQQFKLCRAIENNTNDALNSTDDNNPMEMYCKGLTETTKCYVDIFVETCDMYAAREYMKEHLPKTEIDTAGSECQNYTRYLKEIGVDKDCDEKIEKSQDLIGCRKGIEDAYVIAEQEEVRDGQKKFSSRFCNLTLAGIDCLYNGYLAICGKELASAHLKDYAEIPDSVNMSVPECQELQKFMSRRGVYHTLVTAPSHVDPTVPNPSNTSTPGNNGTSSDTTPGNPGNASSPVPVDTTNGAALAEIFVLEQLIVAVTTALLSYAAAKH